MRYPRFELLALVVGSLSILVGVVATLWSDPVIEEVVAQGLLLVVLVGAVHRGRRGGIATAIFAIVAYAGMRVPMVQREGFTTDVLVLLLTRTLTYAIMGVGGGILCSRIHHFLARFDSTSPIDAQTQLFNQRFATSTLRAMVSQHERFHKTFSVVLLSVPEFQGRNLGPDHLRSLRAAATYLNDHVRLIDDVARLDDGRLVLLLPQTGKPGAHVAAGRLHSGLVRLPQLNVKSVQVDILGAEEDLPAIKLLCGAPATADAAPAASQACA